MRNLLSKKSLTSALGLTLPLGANLPVLADDAVSAIEEIIVTAQKREQNLQEVPISVNVVTGENIAQNSISNLDELSGHVPNLTITEGSQSTNIYIRGLGSGINQGFEQSVGMFIDGIYAGRDRQFRAPLLDVANVEVLRGPQGTLFGKNTIAGALNITTAKPGDELEASVRTTYEPEYNEYSVEGILSGPLTDNLGARLALRQSESDGFLVNTMTGADEPRELETVVRGTLVWDVSDDVQVTAKYETARFDVDGEANRIDEPGGWQALFIAADPQFDPSQDHKRSDDYAEFSDNENESFTLQVDSALGEYTLTSISGYSQYDYVDQQDVDFSPVEWLTQVQEQDFEQFSQEIRLTSPVGDDWDFIAGLYYQKTDLNHHKNLSSQLSSLNSGQALVSPAVAGAINSSVVLATNFGAGGSSRVSDFGQESETWGVFAQATWHIQKDWHLTLGLRYTGEDKEAGRSLYYADYQSDNPVSGNPLLPPALNTVLINSLITLQNGFGTFAHEVDGERSAEDLSPSIKIQHDLNDDVMLYASISRAFKSGGFNEAGTNGDDPGEFNPLTTPAAFDFDEEEALAFELGGKMTLLDGRAILNLALFQTDYEDLQVSAFIGDKYLVGNAAEAITRGLEMDGVVRLAGNLTLRASMAYLDAHYEKFDNASCTQTQIDAGGGSSDTCVQDLSDRELPFAPEWTANIGLDHIANLGENLELRSFLGLNYTGEQYLAQDLDAHTLEDDHLIVNGRVALGNIDGNWDVALVGKNLTDEKVRTYANDIPVMANAHFTYMAPPRTVAVQVSLAY